MLIESSPSFIIDKNLAGLFLASSIIFFPIKIGAKEAAIDFSKALICNLIKRPNPGKLGLGIWNLLSPTISSAVVFTLSIKDAISASAKILSGKIAMDYSVLETLDKCEGSDGITGGLVGPPKFPMWVWLLKYV